MTDIKFMISSVPVFYLLRNILLVEGSKSNIMKKKGG